MLTKNASVGTFLLFAAFAFGASNLSLAAVNPELYQEQGSEALILKIVESESERDGAIEIVRFSATVLEVLRSEIGVEVGETIEVRYIRDHDQLARVDAWFEAMERTGAVGEPPDHSPSPPAAGQTVRAFLKPVAQAEGLILEPAAAHHSFDIL